MMRGLFKRPLLLRCLIAVSGVIFALGPWSGVLATAAPSSGGVVEVTVEVSYRGWNGTPDFVIEVEQGQEVHITFVWADTAVPDNVHRMHIEGYDLQSGLIDEDNPVTTLSLIADQPGTFELTCDWRCEGHRRALQDALLIVQPGAGGGSPAAAAVPTTVSLMPSAWEIEGGPVGLSAFLLDADGDPLPDAPVRFYVHTEFAGTAGEMEVGVARTDQDGVAYLTYFPTFTGEQTVTARFDGFGLYGDSLEVIKLRVLDADPAYTVPDAGLDGLRDWAPVGVVLVLAAVWATFGYVLYQVYHIGRAGR
jgi:hypothetical protein